LIYDAAEDHTLWPHAFNQIGKLLKAVGKVVAMDDPREGTNNMAVAAGASFSNAGGVSYAPILLRSRDTFV